MFELFYSGRSIVLDSPLGVEELTRRLELAFDGTFADGRFCMMRRVRGRNSLRSVARHPRRHDARTDRRAASGLVNTSQRRSPS
jgi:hypothetical protein